MPWLYSPLHTRSSQLDELCQERNSRKAEAQGINAKRQSQLDDWVQRVRRLVSDINADFASYFSTPERSGEVVLREDPSGDTNKYGICIRVKFHDSEQLAPFDHQRHVRAACCAGCVRVAVFAARHSPLPLRQSGGEKSVVTIAYLLATLRAARSPLRMVDEFNQGMDVQNERLLFSHIIESMRTANSQMFVLTPRYLPNFSYGRDATILCVMNGPIELGRFQLGRTHV